MRSSRPVHRRLVAGALVIQALVVLVALTDAPGRPALAIAYALFVPGWAVVGLLRIDDPAIEWPLALAVSVALGTAVAQGLVWAGWWSTGAAIGVLAAMTTPLVALQLLRRAPDPLDATAVTNDG